MRSGRTGNACFNRLVNTARRSCRGGGGGHYATRPDAVARRPQIDITARMRSSFRLTRCRCRRFSPAEHRSRPSRGVVRRPSDSRPNIIISGHRCARGRVPNRRRGDKHRYRFGPRRRRRGAIMGLPGGAAQSGATGGDKGALSLGGVDTEKAPLMTAAVAAAAAAGGAHFTRAVPARAQSVRRR